MRALLKIAAAVLVCAVAPSLRAADTVTALDRYLDGLTSWRATFTESIVDARNKKVGAGRGSLLLQRPGKFRWELAPDDAADSGQLLVADGRNLWFLDRDLQQVTVKPMDAALSQTPAMLLSGAGNIRDAFAVSEAGERDGLSWVRVVPRKAEADFRFAQLGFKGTDLKRMVLEDKLGQTATLLFEGAVRNGPVDPAALTFATPPGVDVIGTPVKTQ
ncbi:MAG: outer membrane lipoprotein chaperone LolA [Steroidobacteraceae bacterium]